MSVFEITMLVCFGAAWPFSIYRSYRSRQVAGKSLLFLLVIFAGYVAGMLHKIFYNYDRVVYLYALNGTMVLVDIVLYLRNRLYHVRSSVVADSRGSAEAGAGPAGPGALSRKPRESKR